MGAWQIASRRPAAADTSRSDKIRQPLEQKVTESDDELNQRGAWGQWGGWRGREGSGRGGGRADQIWVDLGTAACCHRAGRYGVTA